MDHDTRILPEMGARVDFLERDTVKAGAPRPAPVIRVSADAVREENGESVVWIVRDGRLVRRAVTAGPVSGGMREIRRGLAGGEEVVTSGVESPREGMKVKKAGS
jgi:hypothetical protein